MKKRCSYILSIIICLVHSSCKKAFNAHLTTTAANFLAVDGPIISGDSTFITLSRTTSLSDTTQKKVELKATVSVEDDQAKLYPLQELGKGQYALGVTNFSSVRKYRLDIKTSDGKIYQSDFVPMKVTPPVDSLYFKQNSDATVSFYTNTHDPTGNTRYYRWDYKETWSYVALATAFFEFKNSQIVPLLTYSADDHSVCFRTDLSNQIFVGSSANLAQDVILNQELGGLASGTEKTGHVYVMQLRQYALTPDGFNYYQNLKLNTEQLGSIFDAQPTSLNGNIHCISSPSDIVIGFVSASTVTVKQMNLHQNDLPIKTPDAYGTLQTPWMTGYNSYYFAPPDLGMCPTLSLSTQTATGYAGFPAAALATFSNPNILMGGAVAFIQADAPGPNSIEPFRSQGIGYTYYYLPKACIDCRLKGGSSTRPAYFPYPGY